MPETDTTITLFGDCSRSAEDGNTVVIFGMTRGGTSMIAGAVRSFGYHLGEFLDVNIEDKDFDYRSYDHMLGCINSRNNKYSHWGWKFPMAADYLDRLIPSMRRPILIIVSRDAAATSKGLIRWDGREASAALADTLFQAQKNLTLAIRWRCPTLFISYEKVLVYPSSFIKELSHFLSRPLLVDEDRLCRFMQPGSYRSYDEIILNMRQEA